MCYQKPKGGGTRNGCATISEQHHSSITGQPSCLFVWQSFYSRRQESKARHCHIYPWLSILYQKTFPKAHKTALLDIIQIYNPSSKRLSWDCHTTCATLLKWATNVICDIITGDAAIWDELGTCEAAREFVAIKTQVICIVEQESQTRSRMSTTTQRERIRVEWRWHKLTQIVHKTDCSRDGARHWIIIEPQSFCRTENVAWEWAHDSVVNKVCVATTTQTHPIWS